MSTYVGSFTRSRLYDSATVGTVGIVLGVVAFILAIPPITARSPAWPVLVGILAVLFGIVAVTRGGGRVGWGAIAAGTLGGGLAILAITCATFCGCSWGSSHRQCCPTSRCSGRTSSAPFK